MKKEKQKQKEEKRNSINNGFWDKPPEERAVIMEQACERAGESNFFDLSPE